ncbi:MAG TPA: Gfo/Idh/MocA family oxidoreductase [Puia sp.]|nr:Gfo/Idh/MocA family oxidoreductase [Puia sp.]
MGTQELHLGVVGAGGFAKFAVTAFLRVPGVKVVAITDIDPAAAKAFNFTTYNDLEDLLTNSPAQLIYIATPPYLHYTQSLLALNAGKHVICEKPAALTVSDAETLVGLAKANNLLYVVNLMQRYNPLFNIVKTIVDDRQLGDFRHGFFENYASDEFLGPGHWFWDPAKSGGIFIEHGVHFFDLFAGWLGEGRLLSAFQIGRDRVQATVLYKSGPVNFYHGFDQPKILDRQEMRLLFERGDITLFDWVPVKMRLYGLLDGSAEPVTSEYENPAGKQELYQQMLAAMLTDQWAWIKDRTHIRVIDAHNAVQSLRVAAEATAIAQHF